MSYSISGIQGIAPEVAGSFKKAGIRTTAKLLEAAHNPKGRKTLAARTGVGEKHILALANLADRMRIKGVGEDYALLLQAAGVDTIRELRYRNPCKLAEQMAAINTKRKLTRVLPSDKMVRRWIDHAKRLQTKITY
jgi:hypothetical protein